MTSKNKPFRSNSLLLILIAAGFLGACSRDDFPEKIVKPTIAAPAPSTMGFMPAEAQEKSAGATDLTTIATDDPIVKKILAALQADDDKALKAIESSGEGMESVLLTPGYYGNSYEPPEEVRNISRKLDDLAWKNPAVFVKLGQYAERKGEVLMAPDWYESAIFAGSQTAEEKFAASAATNKNGDEYLKLADIFGRGDSSLNAKKAADYLGKALAKGSITTDKTFGKGDHQIKKLKSALVGRNGPDVAASLWILLFDQFPNPHPVTAEAKAEALKTCLEFGGSPNNPESGKGASYEKPTGKKVASACRIALETDEKNRLAMANLGWALERTGDKENALIAYARAAEMGDSWAIAEYWFLRYPDDPKKMRAALEAEAAAGNPWANMAIAAIADAVWNPRDKDSKLREEQLVISASKNIPAAQNYLGLIHQERKNFDEAMKAFKQAAHNGYADAMFNIGTAYENGIGVSKDIDSAKKWYGRAQANGDSDAAKKLASLETTEKTNSEKTDKNGKVQAASVAGEWLCDARSEGISGVKTDAFFGPNGLFAYRLGPKATLISRSFKASGAKGSGYFEEDKGRTIKEPPPYEVVFSSMTPDKLVFELKIKGKNGEWLSSNECVPASGGSSQQSSSGSSSTGDRIADYANNLASEMERASHPACQILANNIRTFGNSGAPEVARERQVEAIVNKAPSFCFSR